MHFLPTLAAAVFAPGPGAAIASIKDEMGGSGRRFIGQAPAGGRIPLPSSI